MFSRSYDSQREVAGLDVTRLFPSGPRSGHNRQAARSTSTRYSKELSNKELSSTLCQTQMARTKKNGFSETMVVAGVASSLRHLPKPHGS